jgi:hypothetical protein
MVGICFIALILLIWFRTDAWLEYARMFRLNRLSFYKDFDEKYKEDVSLQYLHYLRRDHNCFFVRLVTCPICLAVWLGIFAAIFFTPILFPVYVVGGLLLFTAIDRLLG